MWNILPILFLPIFLIEKYEENSLFERENIGDFPGETMGERDKRSAEFVDIFFFRGNGTFAES